MAIVQRGLTLEEFLALPEEKPALEYFNGVVTQKPMPLGEHSMLQLAFCDYVNGLLRAQKVALALPELRATYEGASLVPDVSVYRWERIPRTPEGRIESRFVTLPDAAIEIRSPGQTIRSLSERCLWFVAHDVQVALLTDPRDETIRVFRPGQTSETRRAGDVIPLDELAAGVQLVVADIFAALFLD